MACNGHSCSLDIHKRAISENGPEYGRPTPSLIIMCTLIQREGTVPGIDASSLAVPLSLGKTFLVFLEVRPPMFF